MSKKEKRDSFVFYRSFLPALDSLDDAGFRELMNMIFSLAMDMEVYHSENKQVEIYFQMIKPQIEANYRKAMAGKKGGRPTKAPKKTYGSEEKKPIVLKKKTYGSEEKKPMVKPNANANENVNENVEGKSPKKKYGFFKNVLLTDKEYKKLKDRFNTQAGDKIDSLSEYIASKGKRYKSHYATILSWDRKDRKREEISKSENTCQDCRNFATPGTPDKCQKSATRKACDEFERR